jgi:hypothetical protein
MPRGRPRKDAEGIVLEESEDIGEDEMVAVENREMHLIIREVKKFPQVMIEGAMAAPELDAYITSWMRKGFKVLQLQILQTNEEFVTVMAGMVKQ